MMARRLLCFAILVLGVVLVDHIVVSNLNHQPAPRNIVSGGSNMLCVGKGACPTFYDCEVDVRDWEMWRNRANNEAENSLVEGYGVLFAANQICADNNTDRKKALQILADTAKRRGIKLNGVLIGKFGGQ